MAKTALITGGAGYIGSHLTRQLLATGWKVRVLDSLKFGGESLVEVALHPNFEFTLGDIRDEAKTQNLLEGADAVVHLAAIVGDPACMLFPEEADSVNREGSERLFELAALQNVPHFVFASTCSNYGVMDDPNAWLDEDAALQPQSLYARQKVGFEQFLLAQSEGTAVSILRFATAYGFSPRLRFDLTVNHFTRDLSLGKPLLVFGKELWRPYGHAFDLARAARTILEYGPEAMKGKVYNVGDSNENYTKEDIVNEILKLVAKAPVSYQEGTGGDLRNYRVDFSRIQAELGFTLSKTVPDGIAEIYKLVATGILNEPFSPHYQNC